MAIEKMMTPSLVPSSLPQDEEVEIEVSDEIGDSMDGVDGVVIVLDGEFDEIVQEEVGHDENLADFVDETELQRLATELVQDFENDIRSRKDWAEAYVKGLDQLGMKVEERTTPWAGASGVFHPLLTEAVIRFQAQAMGELFPASGPAMSKIMGKLTPELQAQSERVVTELNYQCTEKMTEYRDEMEHMLFRVPLAGSAFKKIYYDTLKKRAVAMFVPAEDFVVSYGASDLQGCDRYTHVMKKSQNEVERLQINGFYSDVELPEPVADTSDIQEKYNKLQGQEPTIEDDDRHTLLEMHVVLRVPGQEADDEPARPYVITIDKSSRTVLSIYRNWNEDDETLTKREYFVHYRYLPGMGFYGLGLIHLIGGLAKSATSIIRQLIDAGTLSNLPAGLKARGMRIKGDNTPLRPGEFRDVDVPGGTIKDSLAFLPYKEPSAVLYNLLGTVVEEGRRVGSIADIDVGDMNAQAPVGTTLALLERSLKVMSGVQSRMHAALKQELRLIGRIIHEYMPPKYDYAVEGEWDRSKDFDGRVDIIPVSDPNAATMAQRVTQYQAALQLAQGAPQFYDMAKLHRQMLAVLNIQDAEDIVKLPEEMRPQDPVTENMSILNQSPVKAFQYQDHESHIKVHMAAAQDPKIAELVGQSPFASAIQSAMSSHITEHIAMQYRAQIQQKLGVELPDPEAPMPEDVEHELSGLVAQAADKLLRQSQNEKAAQAAQQAANDPLTQIQLRELAVKERAVAIEEKKAQQEALERLDKTTIEEKRVTNQREVEEERIASQERQSSARLAVDLITKMSQQEGNALQQEANRVLSMMQMLEQQQDKHTERRERRETKQGGIE